MHIGKKGEVGKLAVFTMDYGLFTMDYEPSTMDFLTTIN